jgi:invasion protein IalB
MIRPQRLAAASAASALLLLLGIAAAVAQQQRQPAPSPATTSSPAPPAAATPAQTTATYGDWTLRCVRQGEAANSPHSCEVVQSLAVRGQQQPIAQVAVGSPGKGEPLRLTLVVPAAISFAPAPHLKDGDTALLALEWRRCLQTGCFADAQPPADLLQKLRARSEPVQLDFHDATNQDVALPISPRGLGPALDALAKEDAQR